MAETEWRRIKRLRGKMFHSWIPNTPISLVETQRPPKLSQRKISKQFPIWRQVSRYWYYFYRYWYYFKKNYGVARQNRKNTRTHALLKMQACTFFVFPFKDTKWYNVTVRFLIFYNLAHWNLRDKCHAFPTICTITGNYPLWNLSQLP